MDKLELYFDNLRVSNSPLRKKLLSNNANIEVVEFKTETRETAASLYNPEKCLIHSFTRYLLQEGHSVAVMDCQMDLAYGQVGL